MNKHKFLAATILVLIMAALPGAAAVLGQESRAEATEPTAADANSMQATPSCNVSEVEPNDSLDHASAIQIDDVACGTIQRSYDEDWYKFHMPADGYILAEFLGGTGHTWMNLRDSAGQTLSYDFSSRKLLFLNLYEGDYYINLWHSRNVVCQPPCGDYRLILSSPLLISAAAAGLTEGGTVEGIRFFSEDILAFYALNNGEERWRMFFDGSDLNIKGNVTNIAAARSGDGVQDSILISLAKEQWVQGGRTTPSDMIVFKPSGTPTCIPKCSAVGYGDDTIGSLSIAFRGADYRLTGTAEKLDGIDGWVNGNDSCYGFPVSTAGPAQVTSWGEVVVRADNEDIFCKVYNNGNWEPWRYFFDVLGNRNAPRWWVPAAVRVQGLARENVFALAYDDKDDVMYLTIQGRGNILGNTVTQSDIFAINYPSYTWGGLAWHGPDHGWDYKIDAIEWNGP